MNREDLTHIIENFLEESRPIQSPSEVLKQALQKLKQNDSEENINGLKEILNLSKSHHYLIESSMPIVYRKLSRF